MKLRHSVACCMLALGTLSTAQVFAVQVSALQASTSTVQSATTQSATTQSATSNQGYYRAPALHGKTLVFTAEGDLWTQTLGQKAATRLTSLPAEELGAAISSDGKWVAYVANYEGASEVYVIPVAGGVAKRLSFENSRVRVQGWTSKGDVLYSTDTGFGPANNWMLRLVNPENLTTTDLPLADAQEGVIDANHQYVYFTRFGLQVTGDNAKVYRGGAKGELWRFKLGGKDEAELLSGQHQGSVRQPMLWQDRLYFISDSDGNDNIWSMALDGSDVKQLTQYTDWQMRGARINQGQVVFQLGADIHVFDIASATDSLLNIELISDFAQRREHWVKDPMDYATSANLALAGDKVVITARSHVAIAGIDGSRLVQVALPGTYRVRNAILSQDGKSVYAISDMTGQQEIWQFPADGTPGAKQLTKDGHTLRMSLSLSNDGRYLAHDDNDGNVWLLDLQQNTNQKIISNGEGLGPYADIRWSGDSRFIALTKAEIGKQRPQIVLYSLDENKAQALTSDKYESYSPTFSSDGQWLYFLSNRQFSATPSSPWGDRNMGPVFDKRSQIFAIALVKQAKFPFSKPTELTAKTAEKAESKAKPIPVKIDWQGIDERLWQVPVSSGNYSQLSAIDGRLYVLDQAMGDQSQPNLMTIKFTDQRPKAEVFASDVANYGVCADGKKLLLRKKSNEKLLLIVDAGDKLGDIDNAKVQTEQWQLAIWPTLEWQQIFEDAWLMHRDSFFDKKMRGLDWQATKAKYQPLLDRLTDRNELNDIFMQMMGELDSLHSQVRGGDLPKDPNAATGASLGARLQQTRDGVKIAHIYRNDPELPSQASPLSRIEVDAKVGDLLLGINGTPVTNVADVTRLLRNQQDKQVLLELKRAGQRHKTVVMPVSIQVDSQLRYLDWVNHNASVVTEASQGKIGYLHLYAMGGGDIESFAREFYSNYNKDGLIIDVRRNRGGNIDSWIIEKLLRRAWAFWRPTHGTPHTNMQQTFRGHLVVLTDELTYSDGETFSAGIKALGIAPLIGKQTAGAGVWLSSRNLLTDKGIARVAEYPQYAMDGRWILEGHGVTPDIEVDNLPFATFNGQDAQLETAIKYLKDELIKQPIPALQALPMPVKGMAEDIKIN